MANTTYNDVLSSFESMPMSKYVLADGLIKQWFLDAIGDYELELDDLNFDESSNEFPIELKRYQIKTLALLMYCGYLTRELSRAEKLNGIVGKDIQMTGMDASKRVTMADLELELERAEKMLHKQKQHCFV